VLPVASHRPSCLLGDATGAANRQDCALAGSEVDRVAAALAPVVDHKSISHELHRFSSLDSRDDGARIAPVLFRIE
jgi:hypothetical protein